MFSRKAQVQPQPATLPPSQIAPKEKEKEKEKADPLFEQIKRLDKELLPLMKFCDNYTSQIVARVRSLGAAAITDATYSTSFPTISLIQNKYIDLDNLLKGQTANIATPRTQMDLPAPPSTLLNAVSLFNSIQQLQTPLKTSLLTLLTKVMNFANLIKQAQGANKTWADSFVPKAASLQNAMLLAWELGLLQKRITITVQSSLNVKQAYPTMNNYRALGLSKKFDLDKWKKTAISIKSFARAYGKEYTFPQILYHFTKDWDMFERFDFKNWYTWKYRKANKENNMEKQADFVGQDRIQQFMNQRKKFMNRINLVRKALMELINSGLIMQNDSNKLYKIIAMLEFEATNLKAPKLAAARTRRAAKMLDKHGFTEGKVILFAAADELLNPGPLVRTADEKPKTEKDSQEAVELLRQIKREMDSLNYGSHLDSLFAIKKKLETMNRQGDVEAVEKIIRDDLGSLEKLNKKLIEVYTNLSKVPLELSEKEDTELQRSAPKQTAVEVPLEVTEESKPELAAKPTVTPKPENARPATPVAPKPIAPARSAPAIQRNIPNV